jgi:hypothetical protein
VETIYYMVTSSKKKEENTIYMMSSVTDTIFFMMVVAEKNLETMINMVISSKKRCRKYCIEQQSIRKENVNVMYFLITAKR